MRSTPLALTGDRHVISGRTDPDVERLRMRLLTVLEEAQEDTIVPVSLSDKILSASSFAALLGEPLRRLSRGDYPGRYVVIEDTSEGNDWDADAALRKLSSDLKAKLVCVWTQDGKTPWLIGDVDPVVRQTYEFVLASEQAGGPATTRELAEAAKMRIQAASNRVTKAIGLGVVRSVEEQPAEGGGSQRLLLAVR